MALDTLEIFGDEFTGVTGIKATDDNNQIKTYIRPQGTKSIITNGTGIDVTNYASVDVSVPSSGGDSTFVVTLSYNSQTDIWSPDCTYEELDNAYSDGKTVVWRTDPTQFDYYTSANGGDVGYYTYVVFDTDTLNHRWAFIFHSDGSITSDGDTDLIMPWFQTVTKTYTPTTSTQTETVTFDSSNYNGLQAVNVTVNAMPSGSASTPATTITANPSISVNASGLITATTSASKSITPSISAGYVSSGTAGTVAVSGSNTSQLSTQAAATITPTESEQTAVAAGKYTTGIVKVGAISSDYIGSNISRKSSTDLTLSGNTVTAPAGYYESAASKTVASGIAGTPTATKGTVSNHTISVTPSVTNTTGYITGGTKTGTAVTVSASELVSGTKSITDNGTWIDVAEYAYINVNVPTGGEDNTFVITVSYNSQTEMWEPDCTYEEIATAYNSGKEIVATTNTWQPAGVDFNNMPDYANFYVFYYINNHTYYDIYSLYSDGEYAFENNEEYIAPHFQTVNKAYTPTTSTQTETVTFDTSHYYNGLQAVNVTVNAMPSGTAGTPTATKGTVSNHSVSVTPSVTNTTGYITGSTKTGTAVSVSASELVSGSETKTQNGTYDVTNLASLIVNIPFVTYYTGSSTPASSLGSNGDIYLKTS